MARNTGLLAFRITALVFWVTCVVFLFVPRFDASAPPSNHAPQFHQPAYRLGNLMKPFQD